MQIDYFKLERSYMNKLQHGLNERKRGRGKNIMPGLMSKEKWKRAEILFDPSLL